MKITRKKQLLPIDWELLMADPVICDERNMQICFLKRLTFSARWGDKGEYLTSADLLSHMNDSGFDISIEVLRSTVIARLRDENVIIASSNKGYKIPSDYADMMDFIDRVNSTVIPYLKRLNKARESYRQASNGDIDLLKGINYPLLVSLLEQIKE